MPIWAQGLLTVVTGKWRRGISLANLLWLAAVGLMSLAVCAWPRGGTPIVLVGVFWWSTLCACHNLNALRRPGSQDPRSSRTLAQQAVASAVVAAFAMVAAVLAVVGPAVPATALGVATTLLSVVATAAGHEVDLPDLPHGRLGRNALGRRIADGFAAPAWLTRSGEGRFPAVLVIGWGVLAVSSVGLALPAWTEPPRSALQRLAAVVDPPGGEQGQPPRVAPEPPSAAAEPPAPTPAPPPGCAPDRLRTRLTDGWQVPAGIAERVAQAQHGTSWPSVGCDVADVRRRGASTYVIFTGGTGAGVVVDDGHTAALAVAASASLLADADFQVSEGGRSTAVVGLTTSLRAAVGRWQLALLEDGRCGMVLSRDPGVTASYLTPEETAAVTEAAVRMGGFPMPAPSTRRDSRRIDFFIVDAGSPNGFRRQETAPLRAIEPPDASSARTCTQTAAALGRLGAELELASRPDQPRGGS